MSIPLVQNNEKDSINTSIIAIKRNIERINMLLGFVDSGSPDLSGLATKQELEDAITQVETDLTPVDEVTSGNMQSVTSNAVAEKVLKWNNHILNITSIDFPYNTTEIDISNLSYTRAIILGGAVYGSFGTRPIDVSNSYIDANKIVRLEFNVEGWRTFTGSLIIGYY
jgi:hypothetical protein